ncbi:protein kinase [Streptomyces sp. NPDC015131]|uniref:serine/threonine-protein kinase n=1 Tax=Streptomyces sp. NPDC015131 TaxID=3364941 RepID=UPI0036FB3FF6
MGDTRLLQGRYRLEELIGRGGMGEVWRATDESLGRRVAVKCLKPLGPQADRELADVLRERFRREARVAAALQHRGVTVVHDFGDSDGQLYLVMELLEGRNLSQLLADNAQHPLPVHDVVDIAEQVADALAYTHRQGIVHRDLKPANIMRLADGTVKICDFGIARLGADIGFTARLTGTGIAMGTPHYMSPEQISGGQVDHRSDLYSLGCVLYELATGAPPFDLDDAWAILVGHRDTPPEPLRTRRAEVPEFFERAVLDLLAKTPDGRPSDAADLRSRIAAGPAARAGVLPGVPPPPAAGPHAPRSPWPPPPAHAPGTPAAPFPPAPAHSPHTPAHSLHTPAPGPHTPAHSPYGFPAPSVPVLAPAPGPHAHALGLPSWALPLTTGPKAVGTLPPYSVPPPDPAAALTARWTGPAGPATGPASYHPFPGEPGRLADDRARALGPDHPDTLAARHEAARTLARLGRWDEALRTQRQVADGRARVLGPEHPDTLAAHHEVATGLGRLGQWGEALPLYQRVTAARDRVLGPAHPDALAGRDDEAHCLQRLGRHTDAAALRALVAELRRAGGPGPAGHGRTGAGGPWRSGAGACYEGP